MSRRCALFLYFVLFVICFSELFCNHEISRVTAVCRIRVAETSMSEQEWRSAHVLDFGLHGMAPEGYAVMKRHISVLFPAASGTTSHRPL